MNGFSFLKVQILYEIKNDFKNIANKLL